MNDKRPVRALHHPAFRFLWLGMLGGNSGRWAFTMLASWLAYSQTHSAATVGLTVFALQMPAILLSPASGVLADRVPRHRLLIGALSVCGAAVLVAMALLAAGALNAPALVLIAFVIGCGTTVQSTAQNALLPRTVHPDALFEAVALQGTARQGSEFFGPAIASPVLALWGPMAALAVMAVLFLAAAVPVLVLGSMVHAPATENRPRKGAAADLGMLADGARYVWQHDILLPTLLLVATHCLLTMSYMGLLPTLAQGAGIHAGASYGGLMTTVGLGAVAGTLTVATALRGAHAGRLLWVLSLLSAAGVSSLGLATTEAALEGAAFLVGAGTATFMAVAAVRIQRATDDAMRGRVMSIYLLLAGGSMAVGNWAYGALAADVPARTLVIAMGVVFALVVVVAGTFWRPVRRVYDEAGVAPRSTAVAV